MKTAEREILVGVLKVRFEKNLVRHQHITWDVVQAKLEGNDDALRSLQAMEATGGEPDVIENREQSNQVVFCDCSAESPIGRRSLCYDEAALEARRENKPKGSATQLAKALGVNLLTEEQYRHLQTFGPFDSKTSSWISTPTKVRELGGALFCDRRYGQVFVYHNGAESYYSARGFRGYLLV
jgi:uncharacterized protein DUF4256